MPKITLNVTIDFDVESEEELDYLESADEKSVGREILDALNWHLEQCSDDWECPNYITIRNVE